MKRVTHRAVTAVAAAALAFTATAAAVAATSTSAQAARTPTEAATQTPSPAPSKQPPKQTLKPTSKQSTKPSPSATPANAPDRVRITLTTLEPKEVTPHDVIDISGTAVNISGQPLTNVTVALRGSSHRIETRFDLAREADPTDILGTTLLNTRQTIGDLAVGVEFDWHFSLPVERLDLPSGPDDFGAYPLAIDVRSTLATSTATTRLPTTVMWVPTAAHFVPTAISWLLPLTDGIHRGVGTTFTDDALAGDLAISGRLSRLLALAGTAKVPLTYLIDPALVDDATVMAGTGPGVDTPTAATGAPASPRPSDAEKSNAGSKSGVKASAPPGAAPASASPPGPYQVTHGTSVVAGVGAAAAASWLATLRATIRSAGASVVALPYGDTDLVALERAGLTKDVAIARSTGQSTLASELGAPPLLNASWPVDGLLDDATLDELASLADPVVLTDKALPARNPNAVTGARSDLQTASGTVHAVLTDSTISAFLTPSISMDGGARAAEQRFLAETMLVTEQRPGVGSAIVVAPPRHFDPAGTPAALVATLLADSSDASWLTGASLAQVAATPADGTARTSLVYPPSARAAELPPADLALLAGLRGSLSAYSAILGSSTTDPIINRSSVAILRAESSALRGAPAKTAAIRAAVQSALATQVSRVYIVKPGLITMTSRKQKIPITVVNDLPDPVTVEIRLTAVNAARLTVTPQAPFTVPGNQSRHEVLVEVEATTGGRFDVNAQLWTPEAAPLPYGAPVPFVLNSTAYGAVALAIAGSAASLVFLLSAIRITRRIRASRRPTATEPAEPDPSGAA
ncbi:MAG TPA: DUF6049 family protein [Acidothermaceae bacterium]